MLLTTQNSEVEIVAAGGYLPSDAIQSSGGNMTCRQSVLSFKTGGNTLQALQLALGNYYVAATGASAEVSASQAVTFRAGVLIGSTNVRATFNGGVSSTTLNAGEGFKTSDWLYPSQYGLSSFSSNTIIYVIGETRTPGGQYMAGRPVSSTMNESSYYSDCSIPQNVDRTTATLLTNGTFTTATYGEPILAILGQFQKPTRSALIIGDSIADGFGDSSIGTGGYLARGLSSVSGSQIAWSKQSRSGTRISDTLQTLNRRLSLWPYADTLLMNLGHNDVAQGAFGTPGYTSTTIIQGSYDLWTRARLNGMDKVYSATVGVFATSTDSFATLSNQTEDPNFNTLRDQVNTGRSIHPLLTQQINTKASWNASSSLSKWNVNGSPNFCANDAHHPSENCYVSASALVKGIMEGVAP